METPHDKVKDSLHVRQPLYTPGGTAREREGKNRSDWFVSKETEKQAFGLVR